MNYEQNYTQGTEAPLTTENYEVNSTVHPAALKSFKWYTVNYFIFLVNTFPHPGGPQRIMLGTSLFSSSIRKTLSWPRTCSCPKYCVKSEGRICSANGTELAKLCWKNLEPLGPSISC
jgi:hypothetical protein